MTADQQTLHDAHVMVVGCGALGNEVLKNLVLMGIGHLVVVDFDRVEASNLTRSILFRQTDVGRPKTEVVSQRLKEINPSVEVLAIDGDITHDVGLGLISTMDVIIGCTDNRLARYMINRHCMRLGKTWIDGGIFELEGTVRVFAPGQNCYACNLGPEGLSELQRRMPCSRTIRRQEAAGSAPTTSIIASVIGAVQVQEAIKVITGKGTPLTGRMFCYEGEHNTTRYVDFQAYDEDCPEHDRWQPILPSSIHTGLTVAEALATLGGAHPQIILREDVFVDHIYRRQDDQQFTMMCPGRRVVQQMDNHPQLRGALLSDFYQNEYRIIDHNFPYQNLTLSQLGIPPQDLLDCSEKYILITSE